VKSITIETFQVSGQSIVSNYSIILLLTWNCFEKHEARAFGNVKRRIKRLDGGLERKAPLWVEYTLGSISGSEKRFRCGT